MRIIVVLLVLIFAGCSREPTVSFGFEAPEGEVLAVKELEKRGIWFVKKSDGRYEFRQSDMPMVQEIYHEATNAVIPFGRSASHGPKMHKIMVKNLDKAGVTYQIREYQGQDWIVWEESQTEKVQAIHKASESELEAFLVGGSTHNKSLKSGTPQSGAP